MYVSMAESNLFLCLVIAVLVCLMQESKTDGKTFTFENVCTPQTLQSCEHGQSFLMIFQPLRMHAKAATRFLFIVSHVCIVCLVLLWFVEKKKTQNTMGCNGGI